MQQLLGKTKNGFEVFIDTERSHAVTHLEDAPQLRQLLTEFISTIEPQEKDFHREVDTGREVGFSDLVETVEGDEIVYAKRLNRDIYTRFVKNKKPVPSTQFTFRLEKVEERAYELITVYIGPSAPPFPGDQFEAPDSKSFWSSHALAWGTQKIIPGTETSQCPW